MTKHLLISKCGDCPYIEGEQLIWFCNEPSGIDSYGIGVRLGDNSRETLDNIPEWCPLGDCKHD